MQKIKMLSVVFAVSLSIIAPESYSLISGQESSSTPTLPASHVLLVADTAPTTNDGYNWDINKLVETMLRTLGPLSILGWYLYYTATKTLPEKDRQFQDALASFRAEAAADRQSQKESLDAIMAEWRAHSDKTSATTLEIVRNCAKK
jgi:hypothetical protein